MTTAKEAMRSFILGATSNGLPIPAYRFGTATEPSVLILAGVYGDEPEGIEACLGLIQRWIAGFPLRLRVTVVPALNVDGVLRSRRVNARGVDLNRNMATNDWSPETTSSSQHPGPAPNSEPKPVFVLSLHSWKPLLITNGSCQHQATVIAKWTGYSIRDNIGFPTPGAWVPTAAVSATCPLSRTKSREISRHQKFCGCTFLPSKMA